METKIKIFETDIEDKKLKITIGQLAGQANGSVTVQYGDTLVLVTAVMSQEPRSGVNYFPLTVDYEEKLYAAGKIKGSRFIKREGRPSDEAILTSRLIDRALRPRFNQRMRNEVQVIATVLSFDGENDPDIPALIGASTALMISNIPWSGPIAAVRVGRKNNQWLINPGYSLREENGFDLVVAGTKDKINMLEGGFKEVPEPEMISAIQFAQKYLEKIVEFQNSIVKYYQPSKIQLDIPQIDNELVSIIKQFLSSRLEKLLYQPDKIERMEAVNDLKKELGLYLKDKFGDDFDVSQAFDFFEEEIDSIVHKNILAKEKRPDGRRLDQIREIKCQVGILPRTHGSGLFQRGATQVLSILTLGSPGTEQWLDQMELEGKKRFMHHYNFPPYSVGEIGRISGPGRREIGHGALAEKALCYLIPSKDKFPYTIRIVSETLSSNGSSSMASVCGSSLALMDAGVPIKSHIAGIAMGLMTDHQGNYKILTDIQGPEDHHGDMDLKVAGTRQGITALQMDVKIEGVSIKILSDAFKQARQARLLILKEMEKVIDKPRPELSPYAPRIYTLQINPERIRDVIGPSGKTINAIIEETGVSIDIEDSGLIFVTSENQAAAQKALDWIKNLTREVKIGEVFQGKVVRILDFGAMVEILPGQTGLVHISELAPYRIRKVSDVVKIGDIIPVKVKNIDEQGRINLTLKQEIKDKKRKIYRKNRSFRK